VSRIQQGFHYTNPYVFHTDCIGKNTCSGRAAPFMDSIYLNCNQSIYPAQTTYFYNEFYCINGKKYNKQVFSCKDIFNAMQGNMNYECQGTNIWISVHWIIFAIAITGIILYTTFRRNGCCPCIRTHTGTCMYLLHNCQRQK
jgi:hypothetical protein